MELHQERIECETCLSRALIDGVEQCTVKVYGGWVCAPCTPNGSPAWCPRDVRLAQCDTANYNGRG